MVVGTILHHADFTVAVSDVVVAVVGLSGCGQGESPGGEGANDGRTE
jgi:hypothetical protein